MGYDTKAVKGIAGPKPKYEKTLPEIYELDDLKAFFDSLTKEYDQLLFDVLLTMGLREREAMHLEWRDINPSRKPFMSFPSQSTNTRSRMRKNGRCPYLRKAWRQRGRP